MRTIEVIHILNLRDNGHQRCASLFVISDMGRLCMRYDQLFSGQNPKQQVSTTSVAKTDNI